MVVRWEQGKKNQVNLLQWDRDGRVVSLREQGRTMDDDERKTQPLQSANPN